MNTIAQAVTTAIEWGQDQFWEQHLPDGPIRKAQVSSRLATGEASNPYGESRDYFRGYMIVRYGRHWCL